jgi:succinylglutamic semialdehyde dehydrogenase
VQLFIIDQISWNCLTMSKLKQCHYIDAQWVESDGPLIHSENPATGELLWSAKSATNQAVEAAVKAAGAAFIDWRLIDFGQREAIVGRFKDILQQRQEELSLAIHEETGKPLWESKTELGAMIGKVALSIAAYHARTGSSHNENNGVVAALAHRPIGVFAVLGPYNFPGHLPNGHIVPALLAGNTVVFKPSELTPRFGELLVTCWEQAGLPKGVLNLVQGGRETGEALVNAQQINGVLFTGSSKTGHAIHKALGGQPDKMLALEMGGNNPLLVDRVADISGAVYTIIQSAFLSAGQRCTCARRLVLIESENNRKLVESLCEATKKVKVGSDDSCFMGPLISNAAASGALKFEHELVELGAKQLVPLQRPDSDRPLVTPGIIDVTGVAGIADEECFGPLLQIEWVSSIDEGLAKSNNTRYGLSAGLLSDDRSAWDYFYPRINAGIVNFNRPLTGASGSAPFGGIGASGNFRPGAYYAADYSAYPIASMLSDKVELPDTLAPGVTL